MTSAANTPEQSQTALRSQMAVSEEFAYFDHAAVAPLPKPAAQALISYANQSQSCGDVHWLDWAAKVENLRSLAANLLRVRAEEIALVSNTTQGIHLVAEGFPWREGDNVLVPDNEFPSNRLPWKNLERRGVEVRDVPIPASGHLDADLFQPLVDERTRMVALSWVGFASGFRADLPQIVDWAHDRGLLVMLDAIQGLGAFPLDAKNCPVDFICADGHKWMLGPEGAGLFYLRAEHLNLLQPLGLGWNSLAAGAFEPGASQLKETAAQYEGGTTNMPGMHGLAASLNLLLEAGLNEEQAISKAILDNVGLLEDQLRTAGFEVLLPSLERHRSGIVGVRWPEAVEDAKLLAAARKQLISRKVVTSVRDGRLRIATHAYNNSEEIELLVHELVEFRRQTRQQ